MYFKGFWFDIFIWDFPKLWAPLLGDSKDFGFLVSIMRSPHFGKLPYLEMLYRCHVGMLEQENGTH